MARAGRGFGRAPPDGERLFLFGAAHVRALAAQ
jgi:hypothetical protein